MSLQAFISKFNSADGKYAYTIDPLKYFNTRIAFAHGNMGGSSNGVTSVLQNGISNVLNNVSGGLVGKFKNSANGNMKKDGYSDIPSLASATLLEDSTNNILDITYFTQEGTLPGIAVPSDTEAETAFGTLTTHKMAVQPDSKEFSLRILNTKVSLIDRIFYPWMRELSYPYWSYQDQPYETATITIDMTSHNDISYVFLGSRPIKIESTNPTNQLDTNMARSVTFAFDFMYIASVGKNSESIKDTILNTGRSIINRAASTVGL